MGFGSDEQKERFLGPAIRGERIAALGITEPGAGSDVAGIRTFARRVDGGYVVNGSKTFITNGVRADFVVTAVKTTEDGGHHGLSFLILEREMEGYEVSRKLEKLGWRASDTAELAFGDVFVPEENLLGEENRGFYLIMANFQWERLVMALGAVSSMGRVLERLPSGSSSPPRHALAELAVKLEACRCLTYHALRLFAEGHDALREVTEAKLLSQRAAFEVADDAPPDPRRRRLHARVRDRAGRARHPAGADRRRHRRGDEGDPREAAGAVSELPAGGATAARPASGRARRSSAARPPPCPGLDRPPRPCGSRTFSSSTAVAALMNMRRRRRARPVADDHHAGDEERRRDPVADRVQAPSGLIGAHGSAGSSMMPRSQPREGDDTVGVLDGKAAIVTGSARGIGRATAELLAEQGARVLINDLDADVAEQASTEIAGETAVFGGDLTKDGVPDQLVQKAVDEFGQLDIIINNAGYAWDAPIHKISDEQFQAMLDIHTVVPFRILRAASPHLREPAKQDREAGVEDFRKVVNVTSLAGMMGNAGQVAYSAAKGGIVGLTRALAKEWGPLKINVNSIAFGAIDTRLTAPVGTGSARWRWAISAR